MQQRALAIDRLPPQEPLSAPLRWVSGREPQMVDDLGKPQETASGLASRRLAKETGLTEAQAAELVSFLGPHNWASLLREARMLKKS